MYSFFKIDEKSKSQEMVDRSVMALIDCGNCYLDDKEVILMLVSSLMKLTQVDMTSKHTEIKEFMLKL
jgi:hypothetical protein